MDSAFNLDDIAASGAPPGPGPVEITEIRKVDSKATGDGKGMKGE